ncbi:hypothetical protein BGP_1928 [Beggiatoa sp. PS]|nr:hypothetical protein BGP_1928 [Beggiatoa sp. PS]
MTDTGDTGDTTDVVVDANGNPNESCPDGADLVAKYEWDNGYAFEKPEGNESVVTLTGADAQGGTWGSTTTEISYVIVKGGTTANGYEPSSSTGEAFDNTALVNNGGQIADISNIQFCGPVAEETTTDSNDNAANDDANVSDGTNG